MRQAKRRIRPVVSTAAACACLCAVIAGAAGAAGKPIGAFTTRGAWSFVSAPKLHPPKLTALGKPSYGQLAGGSFLLANFKNLAANRSMTGESGPMILDSHLNPIWFAPIGTGALAANLKLQSYGGKPALSWWQGVVTKSGVTTKGEVELVDNTYRQVARVTAPAGWVISLHDAIVSGNSLWVTAYRNVSSAGGPVLDSAVQRYDLTTVAGSAVKTGTLVYTWSALAHIPLSDSFQKQLSKTEPWDAYHVNSVQLIGTHEFLVSMRNTSAAYLVDTNTGGIVWTLGGKRSSFTPKQPFHFQHDVELHGSNVVSVFDDACCAMASANKFAKPFGTSRGLLLKIDVAKHTVKQTAQYKVGKRTSAFLGNTQPVGRGNVLVGWGSQPFFSEFNKRGKLLLDVQWPTPDQSYRAYLQKWHATPFFPPSGAVRKAKTGVTVYASWDGATEVSGWRVLGGNDSSHLKRVGAARKSGFETAISLTKSDKVYEVQAVDGKGKVIGTSPAFPTSKSPNSPGAGFY